MIRSRSRNTPVELLAGLRTQARRARDYYAPTIDPAASARTRILAGEFVRSRLARLRADAAASTIDPSNPLLVDEPLPVWSYWNGPERDAPPLVQACFAQLRRTHPTARILDSTTARELAPLPAIVERRLRHRPAHLADVIRLSLLERHGGIWVDATAYVPASLTAPITAKLTAGVFYLRWGGQQISNWLIGARRGNPLIALQRATLEAWWTERDELPDYFLFHRFYEALVAIDADARRIARAMPRASTIPGHLLQLAMLRPYDPDEVRRILDIAMAQKLSYKYSGVPAGSVLERLLIAGLL